MGNPTPIGIGAYPLAALDDLLVAIPQDVPVTVLAMGASHSDNITLFTELKQRRPLAYIQRRLWTPDPQVDFGRTPQSEAYRWFSITRAGMSYHTFSQTYSSAAGINELYDNGHPEQFRWLMDFELELCRLWIELFGTQYFWGQIAPGNVDPSVFAHDPDMGTADIGFAPINRKAIGVNYHAYAKPNNKRLEAISEPWWAWRASLWHQECQRVGLRMPAVLYGESGTWDSWSQYSMTDDEVVRMLRDISEMCATQRASGINVLGHCLFSVGAEGDMGHRWNVSRRVLELVGEFNSGVMGAIDKTPLSTGTVFNTGTVPAPTPAPTPIPTGGNVTEAELVRYAADLYKRFNVTFNRDAATTKYFLAQLRQGNYLGAPLENEHRTENNLYVYQAFSSKVLYAKVGEWVVREGLPPLA